jgi:GH35 family endo-1,4-beta-xylanase
MTKAPANVRRIQVWTIDRDTTWLRIEATKLERRFAGPTVR